MQIESDGFDFHGNFDTHAFPCQWGRHGIRGSSKILTLWDQRRGVEQVEAAGVGGDLSHEKFRKETEPEKQMVREGERTKKGANLKKSAGKNLTCTEVMLKDRILDKTLSFKVNPIEVLDGGARIRCALPEGLNPIAFSLYVNSESTGEKKCSRPLIVSPN